jgi:hypothetical protein
MYTITNPVLNDTNSQHPITASLRTPTVYNTTIFSFFNGLKLQSLSVCLAMTNAYGILRANADSSNYPAVQFSPNESTLYTSYSNILGTAWKTIKTNGGMEGDNVTTNWGSNTTNKYGLAVNQLITAQSSGAAASRTVTFSLGINYP